MCWVVRGSVGWCKTTFLERPALPLEAIQWAALEAFREQLLRHVSDDGLVDQHVIATLFPRLPAPADADGARDAIVEALTEAFEGDHDFDSSYDYSDAAGRYADRLLS